MTKQDWFAPIALIIGWMERGEGGFAGFRMADLATAIEITDVLHIDRFGRLKKAGDELKNSYLDSLAKYLETINTATNSPELQSAAASGNWDKFQEVATEQRLNKKQNTALPNGSDKIGWMFESLSQIREQAIAKTRTDDSPAAREKMIKDRVNAMVDSGQTKQSAYAELAKEQSVKSGTIKKIYLRKKK